MINEAQAVALMNEANPVPDLEEYQVTEAEIAAYLGTLEQRSKTVTQLDTKASALAETTKRSSMWLVAAVAIVVLGALAVFLTTNDTAPIADSPEGIEELARATLGDQLTEIGNYEEREGGWFFTVEYDEFHDADVIQATTQRLAEAFMLQGVETIGVTVRTPEHEFGQLLFGAKGAIVGLNNTNEPVVIDWHPAGHDYIPEDYTFDGCAACP